MALYAITADNGAYHERQTFGDAYEVWAEMNKAGETGAEIHEIR